MADLDFVEPQEKLKDARDVFLKGDPLEDKLVGLTNVYHRWVEEPTYCSIEYLDHETNETKFKFWRAPKRGNDRYVSDVKDRLEDSLPSTKDLRKKGLLADEDGTNVLHIVLTVDPKRFLGSIESAWRNISYYLNKFLSAFRKRYGKTWILRSYESQRNGFPHIHLFIISEHEFNCEWYHGKDYSYWLIPAKERNHNASNLNDKVVDGFENLWFLGFVKARGIGDRKHSDRNHFDIGSYVVKDVVSDVTKAPDLDGDVLERLEERKFGDIDKKNVENWKGLLSLSLNWLFRKQSFSISGSDVLEEVFDLIPLCLIQTDPYENGLLESLFDSVRNEFVRFVGIVKLPNPPPDGFVSLSGEEIDELETKAIGPSSGLNSSDRSIERSTSDHLCETCKDDFGLEREAEFEISAGDMNRWLCSDCASEMGVGV